MKSFNKFIEEMAFSVFESNESDNGSNEDESQSSALQRAKERFAKRREDAKDRIEKLKSKAKTSFKGVKFGKQRTRFTKQSGEKY